MKEPALDRFESPSALVAYLTSPSGDLDHKDRIYSALVRAVQSRVDWSELATAILWLGLWPALDRIYRSRVRDFSPEYDKLVSAMGVSFMAAVARADLSRIHRVAATLTKNAERNVADELHRGWNQSAKEEDREDDRLEEAANEAQRRSGREAPPGVSERFAFTELRARLLPVVGGDMDLLLAVLVLGETQREAADRLGISHAAARKRFQRALDRARKNFREVCPSSPREPAFLK